MILTRDHQQTQELSVKITLQLKMLVHLQHHERQILLPWIVNLLELVL